MVPLKRLILPIFSSNEPCITIHERALRAIREHESCYRLCLDTRSCRRRRTCVSAQIRSSSLFFFSSVTPASLISSIYTPHFSLDKLKLLLSAFGVFLLSLGQRYWRRCSCFTFLHFEITLVTLWLQDLANDWVLPPWMAVQNNFFVAGGVCTCTACREAVGAPCWIFKQAHLLFPSMELCTFGPCLIVEARAQASPALWGLWLIPLKVLLLFSFVTKTKRGIGVPACVISKWLLAFEVLNARCFISFLLDFHYRPIIKTFLLVCS